MLHLRVMSRYICIVVKENLSVGSHCDITTNHTLNRSTLNSATSAACNSKNTWSEALKFFPVY